MIERFKRSYADPVKAERYRFALLMLGTAFCVVIGVGNAIDAPEAGSVYEEEDALGILLVIGQTLPLAIVFRYPLAALAVIMVSLSVHSSLDYDVIWIVQFTALISSFLAIIRGGNRESILVLALVYIGVVLTFGVFKDEDRTGNVLVQFLLFGGLWIVGNLFRTRRIRLESTEHVLEALELEQDRQALEAVRDERVRIARDLHDIVGHTLNIIVLQAAAAQTVFKSKPDQALEALNAIEGTARQSLSDMERMLGILRPPEGDEVPYAPQHGLQQVETLAKQFVDAGLPVEVNVTGEPHKLPTSLDLTAYRIIQEALTNTLKHAGPARAQVAIKYVNGSLELDITNDGNSTVDDVKNTGGGRGLIGMKERVALFGGELDVGPGSDGGFRVHAILPFEESH